MTDTSKGGSVDIEALWEKWFDTPRDVTWDDLKRLEESLLQDPEIEEQEGRATFDGVREEWYIFHPEENAARQERVWAKLGFREKTEG